MLLQRSSQTDRQASSSKAAVRQWFRKPPSPRSRDLRSHPATIAPLPSALAALSGSLSIAARASPRTRGRRRLPMRSRPRSGRSRGCKEASRSSDQARAPALYSFVSHAFGAAGSGLDLHSSRSQSRFVVWNSPPVVSRQLRLRVGRVALGRCCDSRALHGMSAARPESWNTQRELPRDGPPSTAQLLWETETQINGTSALSPITGSEMRLVWFSLATESADALIIAGQHVAQQRQSAKRSLILEH